MVRVSRRAWWPMAVVGGLVIVGAGGLEGVVGPVGEEPSTSGQDAPYEQSAEEGVAYTVMPTAVGIRKHALGYTTALGSSEVGKVYVPSRYGGVLRLGGYAKLYYTSGADLTSDVAGEILAGNLEGSCVATGNPCAYTVPAGRWGWFYIVVPGGTSGIANTFLEEGHAAYRPWNGWWWPLPNSNNPNLYDAGGPLEKFDRVYDGTSGPATPTARTTFYQQNMNANPGWSTTGNWAFGTPTGGQGTHGGKDPTAGYTGSYVYGYNLAGGYENNMTAQYLTTTAIDCSGRSAVHLRFRRWLCIEQSIYDHASIQVSTNQSTWTTVWNFSGATLTETAWSLQEIDISSVADGQPAVYIRWVMGPTDVGWTYGGWNIDDVELTANVSAVVIHQEMFNSDPGWSKTGNWAFGTPTGGQGTHGGKDPTAGYTGSYVYGYNLAGGYENNMAAQYLTTPAIDCSGYTGVHLRFRRWLCIEQSIYDHASIQVSANGSTWTTVWDFSGATLTETAWSVQDIDISSVADGQATVYIRWVMGPTDVGWTYGGWNIDDVEITGRAAPSVTTFYQLPLDSNPSWSTTGNWAFGTPTGGQGTHGGKDPTAGYTGSYVYGYNLAGGYENNMTAQYLTSTAIPCTGQTGVHLRFRRWLGIEESIYDHASIQVSTNRSTWTTVWDFSGATLTETAWSLQEVDISSVADNQPVIYIRWVMGPTDVGWTYGGWNIDDIELTSGNAPLPEPYPKTYAQSWEATNQSYGDYWFGHCWGWSIAAILIPQPNATTKRGVSFTRDDMEGLYTELADTEPYADSSLSIPFIPATAPSSNVGQDVDLYCDDMYRVLRTSIREDRVPLQSDMRAVATPPNKSNEVWNQSIYKYFAYVREVSGSNNERLVEFDMDVWSNYGPWAPPTDYTNDRHEEFIFRLEFNTQGQVISNSSNQNWVYASHYPPRDIYRLTGSPYTAKNSYVTKSRVDALYEP